MYLLTTVLFGVGLLFWTFDGCIIVKEKVCEKWRKFRQLNKLVEVKYKTIGMVIWVSVQLIAKMYWTNFLQWANNTIRYKDKRTIEITYVIRGRCYTMVVKPHRGPSSVLLVTDQDHEDVSDEVLPFLGVSEDWHRKNFTPNYWGKESLTFEMSMGEPKTFQKDEIIDLNTN